jgi:hypothetical protein
MNKTPDGIGGRFLGETVDVVGHDGRGEPNGRVFHVLDLETICGPTDSIGADSDG